MDNELRKTLDVKLNINIDGTAAFGIVLASIAGLCFCFYTGTKSRYSAQIGSAEGRIPVVGGIRRGRR